MDNIVHHVEEISRLLSACDRSDREMIKKNNQPYLDGWFGPDGKLRSEVAEVQPGTVGFASTSPTVPDPSQRDVDGDEAPLANPADSYEMGAQASVCTGSAANVDN